MLSRTPSQGLRGPCYGFLRLKAHSCAPPAGRGTVRFLSAPMPPSTRALAPLACLALACNFDARGLGETTDVVLSASDGSSGAPQPGSTGLDPSTGEPAPGSSSGGDSSGEPACSDDCPPTPAWTVTTPGEAHALALDLALDGVGDVVIVGDRPQASNAAQSDAWAAKFAGQDGAGLWEARYNGAEKARDFARGVAFAGDGTVVVVGGSQEVMGRRVDLWVAWYAGDTGQLERHSDLMTGHWNGEDGKVDEWAEAVAIAGDGGLVLAGSRCAAECEIPDAWIGHFDAAGETRWGEPMLPIAAGSFLGLLVDGDVLVPFGTDGYPGSPSPWRTLLRRLDDDGAGIWSALPDPPGADQPDFVALAAALAGDGGLWVVGSEITVGPERGFLRLYRPERGDTPVAELHGPALPGSLAALALTADDTPIVAGSVGRGRARHLWLAQFTAELAPVWRIDESDDEVNDARGLARDADGGLVVVGVRLPGDGTPPGTWLRRYLPGAP